MLLHVSKSRTREHKTNHVMVDNHDEFISLIRLKLNHEFFCSCNSIMSWYIRDTQFETSPT